MINNKKIIVVMPAYNAEKQIASVFERISASVWAKIAMVIVINDGSTDATRKKLKDIIEIRGDKVTVVDKAKNEGYARAQKDGFKKALGLGADIVVLLHSDGQYAPEIMPRLLDPLEHGEADIVQGSRMISKKEALRGGMPIYKFIANVFLSTLENWVYGLNFAEYHSGYMLYSRKALEIVPYQSFSDTFHFDGEMLFVSAKKGLRVKEISIPTLYANEKSHVKPIQYGFQVLGIMIKYLLGKYNV